MVCARGVRVVCGRACGVCACDGTRGAPLLPPALVWSGWVREAYSSCGAKRSIDSHALSSPPRTRSPGVEYRVELKSEMRMRESNPGAKKLGGRSLLLKQDSVDFASSFKRVGMVIEPTHVNVPMHRRRSFWVVGDYEVSFLCARASESFLTPFLSDALPFSPLLLAHRGSTRGPKGRVQERTSSSMARRHRREREGTRCP